MTTPTLRRLDDRERYWGLSWPGWVAVIAGVGALYLAIKLSPLSMKPTITITLFVLALVGMVLYGVSGQALSPGRQLLAILRYRRSPKLLELSERVQRCGLVLDAIPEPSADHESLGEAIDADELLDHQAVDEPEDDWSDIEADDAFAFGDGKLLSTSEQLSPPDPLSGAVAENQPDRIDADADPSPTEPGAGGVVDDEDL